MITLYRDAFWISPYVFSCFVALEEKALTYQVKEISLGDGAQQASSDRKVREPAAQAIRCLLSHD